MKPHTTEADAKTIQRLTRENDRLRRELEAAHGERVDIPTRVRLTEPPKIRPKPRLTLEEAREQAAQAAAMWRVPDRPEDSDA